VPQKETFTIAKSMSRKILLSAHAVGVRPFTERLKSDTETRTWSSGSVLLAMTQTLELKGFRKWIIGYETHAHTHGDMFVLGLAELRRCLELLSIREHK